MAFLVVRTKEHVETFHAFTVDETTAKKLTGLAQNFLYRRPPVTAIEVFASGEPIPLGTSKYQPPENAILCKHDDIIFEPKFIDGPSRFLGRPRRASSSEDQKEEHIFSRAVSAIT